MPDEHEFEDWSHPRPWARERRGVKNWKIGALIALVFASSGGLALWAVYSIVTAYHHINGLP